MTTDPTANPLSGRALEEYGAERIRNDAFDQIRLLWERRKQEGWTQKRIAEAIGRDPGWVSRNLSAPGNWTVRTIGAFTQALFGEAELKISALEDTIDTPTNYDAYDGYLDNSFDIEVSQPSYAFDVPIGSTTFIPVVREGVR
jgi:transcriptional regulator with XRE-family HTH domain